MYCLCKEGGFVLSKFENEKGPEFFAAANSGEGFVSFYEEIFNSKEIVKRYLIKGGPGTGKSSFMRKVADDAKKKGSFVTYYHCSSDPSSLDGIIIDGKTAVIDSTAPHVIEPLLVGARDTIVDLGAFWDSNILESQVDRIALLGERKRNAYKLCYRFLSGAMQSDIAFREIFLPFVDIARIEKTARRLTKKIEKGSGYSLKIGLSSAIGMFGKCELKSYEQIAKHTVFIEDRYGLGFLLLSKICDFAIKNQNKICVSYCPLCPNLPDAVYFEEQGIAFVVSESKKEKCILLRSTLSFNDISQKEKRALRERARNAKKLSESLVVAACDELALAGEAHFELEKIYSSAMDFSALNLFIAKFIEKI